MMAKLTIGFGMLLAAIGIVLGTCCGWERGCIRCGLGWCCCCAACWPIPRTRKQRMLWMHIAVTVGAAWLSYPRRNDRGGVDAPGERAGDVTRGCWTPRVLDERILVAVVCLVYTGLCVRSFLAGAAGSAWPRRTLSRHYGKFWALEYDRPDEGRGSGPRAAEATRKFDVRDANAKRPKPKLKKMLPHVWALVKPRLGLLSFSFLLMIRQSRLRRSCCR